MHPRFAALAESLHPSFVNLISSPPHTGRVRLPLITPRCGVYLFSEGIGKGVMASVMASLSLCLNRRLKG